MPGFDFHRQRPIDQFIVDFFCHELWLAVEIDGGCHETEEAQAKDKARQERLESLGVKFLRFRESDILRDVDGATDTIRQWIKANDAQCTTSLLLPPRSNQEKNVT